MDRYHVNRQIGDYVIYSKEENVAPFLVRMAGDDNQLSTHCSITEAVKQIKFYQAKDQRGS